MHVTIASRRLGWTSRWRAGSELAKATLLAISSSITPIGTPLAQARWPAPRQGRHRPLRAG